MATAIPNEYRGDEVVEVVRWGDLDVVSVADVSSGNDARRIYFESSAPP